MESKKVISEHFVHKTELPRLAMLYVSRVIELPGATQEVMLVKDKVNWQRFFWNPIAKLWNVSTHDRSGWTAAGIYTTDEVLFMISSASSEEKDMYHALQHRTTNGISCYMVHQMPRIPAR